MRPERANRRFRLFCWLLAMPAAAGAGTHEDVLAAVRADRTDEVVRYLQLGMGPDTCDATGTTLLMTAAANGNVPLVKALLELRSNTLKQNRFGETALALAALNGHGDAVRILVEAGAGINVPGWGALHYAAYSGHGEIVRYLIDRGADVNLRAPNRYTALMLAARNGRYDIVRMLLAAGANPEMGDLEGNTAVGIARKAGNHDIAGLLSNWTFAGR